MIACDVHTFWEFILVMPSFLLSASVFRVDASPSSCMVCVCVCVAHSAYRLELRLILLLPPHDQLRDSVYIIHLTFFPSLPPGLRQFASRPDHVYRKQYHLSVFL